MINSLKKIVSVCFRSVRVWLLMSLSVSILLAVTFEILYRSPKATEFEVEEFGRELDRQKIFLELATIKLAAQIAEQPELMWELVGRKKAKEHEFLVFRDTSLIAWTSHLLPLNNVSHTLFERPVARLANGWYLSAKRPKGKYTVVGLMGVKNEYEYQNKYLVNAFAKVFDISDDVPVLAHKSQRGIDVTSPSGEYFFTLAHKGREGKSNLYGHLSLLFLLMAMVSFAALVNYWFIRIVSGKKGNLFLWAIVLFTFLLFFVLFVSGWYHSISVWELFSPVHFAFSAWLSSIGSFVVAALLVAWLSYLFYRFYVWGQNSDKPKAGFVIGFGGLALFFWIVNVAAYVLVEHSTEVYLFGRIVDMTGMQMAKLVGMFLLFLSFALWADFLFKRYLALLGWRFASVAVVCVSAAVWGVNSLTNGVMDGWSVLFLMGSAAFGAYYRQRHQFYFSFRHVLWLVLLFGIYAEYVFFKFNMAKEKDNRKFLIETLSNKLAGEQDAVAEMYLTEFEKRLAIDPYVQDMVANKSVYEDELRQYLVKNYFYGYLSRYEIQVIPCWPKADLFVEGSNQTYDCYRYFAEMVQRYGEPVSGSKRFFFMKKDNGRINYFGVFRFFVNRPGLETSIFIEFTSKPFFEGLGYPELLVSDKDQSQIDLLNGYSYAKYVNGHLAKRSGSYLYQVTNQRFDKLKGEGKYFVYANKHSHLVYVPRVGTNIVMSYPAVGISNVLMAFTVIYSLFLVLSFAAIFLARLGHPTVSVDYSIRERIQIALVAFSLLFLVALGISSVLYAMSQYKSKNYEMLSQRLKSIMMEMEQKVGGESRVSPEMAEYLNYVLQTFSNVFYTDINLFGLDGRLLATSRPELYQKGLIGNYMHPDAYKVLALQGEREFIHNESIGSLSYISAYVPFLNQRNEVLAYLNLPYFVGHNELREEVSAILVAMINAYVVFILLAIGMALVASRQITRPLLLLQQRLSQTRLGLKNEKINYDRRDEIGHLVEEYNRMVDELAQSAEKLARSERELAWREMAKQIAHEIKNPLTPMQLSVQYLQKAWDDKVPDFDSFIHRVSKTLIDHIRQLSVIATEFSHFAKMPPAKVERIDLADKLLNTIALYEKSSGAVFRTNIHSNEPVYVNIDGEQMLSVFNNLIKNGLQSVLPGIKPEIQIEVSVSNGWVELSFADNGRGIAPEVREKMFVPNFTTKTSGMGLGLAITKNIVEAAGGSIRFETEEGNGSVFYVCFPVSPPM